MTQTSSVVSTEGHPVPLAPSTRLTPAVSARMHRLAKATELVGCSPSTLRRYAQHWERAFGPLPRNSDDQPLFSDHLTNLFQHVFELPDTEKRNLSFVMRDCGHDQPEVLLEIAREYHVSPEAAHGKIELVNTLLLFVLSRDVHENRNLRRHLEAAREEHSEAIAELSEWAREMHALVFELVADMIRRIDTEKQQLKATLRRTRLRPMT